MLGFTLLPLANYVLVFDRHKGKKNNNKAIVFHSSSQSIQTMEHEFYECPEYLSNTPAEVERMEEYEYEVQFGHSELFYWMLVRPRAFLMPLSASFPFKIQCQKQRSLTSCTVFLLICLISSTYLRLSSSPLPHVRQLCSPLLPFPEIAADDLLTYSVF